ncbi:hypothetical protein ACFLT8_04550 [Chloroflexota bacterium]
MQEEALDNYLSNLVEQGKITRGQADQYKTWLQARPDMEPFRAQLEEWGQARLGMPFGFNFRGHGGFRLGGLRSWCGSVGAPLPTTSKPND